MKKETLVILFQNFTYKPMIVFKNELQECTHEFKEWIKTEETIKQNHDSNNSNTTRKVDS